MIERLLAWIKPNRPPDNTIGFLERWFLVPRTPLLEVFLNHFIGSDKVEALHDHPSFTLSLVLKGGYIEHLKGGVTRERGAGDVLWRSPWMLHRIEMKPGGESWSIFITGPRLREWGFMTAKGWVSHKEFFG